MWWDFADGGVGSSVVVEVDEFVEEGLEFGECVGWWPGFGPFLEGLLEAFDFPGGGGMVWSGVFVGDAEFGESGFDLVAASLVAGESCGVNGNPAGSCRYQSARRLVVHVFQWFG